MFGLKLYSKVSDKYLVPLYIIGSKESYANLKEQWKTKINLKCIIIFISCNKKTISSDIVLAMYLHFKVPNKIQVSSPLVVWLQVASKRLNRTYRLAWFKPN
ncbi:unnamed protein product [Timema podura]|uniref:Uncharacterized protein n=1 Tax=Timema podura TaxID=61482 RepID=A0ABN7NCZ4_TIMPD|nr:unnamed protein product [Timema podura]